jgi:signal transduction histidine kinase
MTLAQKLILIFFGAVQITFLTAAAAFWAARSWYLTTVELSATHEQTRRLERIVSAATAGGDATGGGITTGQRPRRTAFAANLSALAQNQRTDDEGDLIAALGAALDADAATDGSIVARRAVRRAARPLARYYDDLVRNVRARTEVVTRYSTALLAAIVLTVLVALMGYYAAMRVWLFRPIQAISRDTKQISGGDLEHRIRIIRQDEFGRLAGDINAMANSLLEHQRRLLVAERFALIGEMSAYVAHNIRNPVASIRATAQSELAQLPAGNPQRAALDDVVLATDRIVDWVGDLLRYATPVSLDKTTTDVNRLLSQCVELMRPRFETRRMKVALALDPALPPVALDRNKMEQVVGVVLTNAFEAAPEDSTIEVSAARDLGPNGAVLATVRIGDRGGGVPENRLRTLFTPFATGKKSGTGLGLSLAHKIVTAHFGTIAVANRDGGGTVVEITLPATGGV